MEIIMRPLADIKPYGKNPRKNDEAVDGVAASLREFGWQQPIVIDSKGVIIAGHTRYKAAIKLGMTEAPCIVADGLTPAQVKAYRLADNKTGEKAQWDFELLELELADILEIDMEPFGFEGGDTKTLGLDDFCEPDSAGGKSETITCPKCGFEWVKR